MRAKCESSKVARQPYTALNLPMKVAAFLIALILLVMLRATAAQAAETMSVVVKEGETMRNLAQAYLDDPDLWNAILRFNDIEDVATVVPGMTLNIPVGTLRRADHNLDAALAENQRATEAGAKVFARRLMGEAVRLYDAALMHRKDGRWEAAARTAAQAKQKAQAAYAEAITKRDAKARAILSYRKRIVHGLRPQEADWRTAEVDDFIIEQEKVRTLANSEAEILFQDESDLRLREFSQVIIRAMRIDLLKQKAKTKVSLVSGNLQALLKGASAKKIFEVDVNQDQGVHIENESRHFMLKHDAASTKLANYDTGQMRVTSAGGSVMLGKNEGTMIKHQQKPEKSFELIAGPELTLPKDNEELFRHHALLTWKPVISATGYWLEVSPNPRFRPSVVNQWGIKETQFFVGHLDNGAYYWRLAALDGLGLAGTMSQVRRFSLQSDTDAPYLMIVSPQEGEIISTMRYRLTGTTEGGVTLTLNGQPVNIGPEGNFEFDYTLQKGINTLVLKARDSAGHVTTRQRTILHLPNQETVIRYDRELPQLEPKHFLTRVDTLTLSGTTTARWQVQAQSASGRALASSFADDNGHFVLSLPVQAQSERLTLLSISPSGFVTQDTLTVTKDQEPPTITVDELPPGASQAPEFRLRGQLRGADSAKLNDRVLALAQGRFDAVVRLQPGPNRIVLTACDQVGNEAVASWVMLHDRIPPELVSHRVSRARTSHSEVVLIIVNARDASGLKQAAPYQLQIGQSVHAGFLKLNKAKQTYQDVIPLPQKTSASIKLQSVELGDYAGNRRSYVFK